MMKKLLFIALFISCFTGKIEAQTALKADAGKDTIFCIDKTIILLPNTKLKLGGNKTATGGIPPYSYNWMISLKTQKNDSSFFKKYCSNIDSSNLYIKDFMWMPNKDNQGIFILKVKVTDSQNTVSIDSSTIILSILDLGLEIDSYLNDSIKLGPIIFGGIYPLSFQWSPNIGISNPYIQNPTIKYSNIKYNFEITDSVGCKYTFKNYVTDLKNGDLKTGYVSYKNPVSQSESMNFTSELIGSMLQIVSSKGVVMLHRKIAETQLPLGSIITESGIYYYTLTTIQGKVLSGSFVRE